MKGTWFVWLQVTSLWVYTIILIAINFGRHYRSQQDSAEHISFSSIHCQRKKLLVGKVTSIPKISIQLEESSFDALHVSSSQYMVSVTSSELLSSQSAENDICVRSISEGLMLLYAVRSLLLSHANSAISIKINTTRISWTWSQIECSQHRRFSC